MANFTRNGFGQVEANQLSGQKTGQIYASLPLDEEVKVLQNGEFMYYDLASGKVTSQSSFDNAEPMLVFNEVKLYDDIWRDSYKDFAMIRVSKDAYVTERSEAERMEAGIGDVDVDMSWTNSGLAYHLDGIVPRMLKTNVGDIFTTNMVKVGVEYAEGDLLKPVVNAASKTLVLEKTTVKIGMLWIVAKVYTMPDGQPGLKLQRVQ